MDKVIKYGSNMRSYMEGCGVRRKCQDLTPFASSEINDYIDLLFYNGLSPGV